ncbi:MAG: hypothetical protein IKW09_01295, partial [Alphaproteobacteria bacterium]|nr:hypothetical protein [Alphaproteobacteria bacterium]
MSYDALRDLDLAGVQWELADVPIAIPRPKMPPEPVVPPRPTAATIVAEIGRSAPSVVPPIDPRQTMSLETVRAMATRPNDMNALNRMIGEFNHPLRATAT